MLTGTINNNLVGCPQAGSRGEGVKLHSWQQWNCFCRAQKPQIYRPRQQLCYIFSALHPEVFRSYACEGIRGDK